MDIRSTVVLHIYLCIVSSESLTTNYKTCHYFNVEFVVNIIQHVYKVLAEF